MISPAFLLDVHIGGTELIWLISLGTLVFTLIAFFFVLSVVLTQKRAWNAKMERLEAIREREEKYRDLFDNVSDVVYIHSLDGIVSDINAAGVALIGSPVSQIVGNSLLGALGNLSEERLSRYLGRLKNDGRDEGILCLAGASGGTRYLEYSSSVIRKDGQPIAVRGMARDITARHLAEKELRRSEQRLKDLVRLAPVPMLIVVGRTIRYANLEASLLFRASSVEELLDVPIDRFLAYDFGSAESSSVSNPESEGEILTAEMLAESELVLLPDGEEREVEITSVPIRFAGKEARHIVIRDVTEERHLAASLRELPSEIFRAAESERSRIAGELHDSVIQMLALGQFQLQMVEMNFGATSPELNAQLVEVRSRIESCIAEVKRIYRGLRPAEFKFGLKAAVDGFTAEVARIRNIEFETRFERFPLRLPPETELTLFRIVQESINNVQKHANATLVTVDARCDQGMLLIDVSDNGKGVPTSVLSPDGDSGGRGFGLRSMRERARFLGGSCVVSRRAEGGTLVSVRVPYTLPEETASTA